MAQPHVRSLPFIRLARGLTVVKSHLGQAQNTNPTEHISLILGELRVSRGPCLFFQVDWSLGNNCAPSKQYVV